MKIATLLCALLAALTCGDVVSAEGWGSIKGKFIVAGPIQPPAPLVGPAAMGPIPNPQLLLGPAGELQNVAIWLTVERGETYPDPHPSYAEGASDTIEMSSNRIAITPHVTFIRTSQTIRFRNVAAVVTSATP